MNDLTFRDISIDSPDLLTQLNVASADVIPLAFVLKWTNGRPVSLFSLVGQIVGSGNWKNLIQNAVNDNDGEILVPVGHFLPGTEIELRFGVFAMEDVPKAATFLARPGLVEWFRPQPDGKTQRIQQAETWRDGGTYKV